MTNSRGRLFDRILLPATSKSALSPQVIFTTSVVSVILHIASSPDLGFQAVIARTLVAAAAALPMFGLIWLAHRVNLKNELTHVAWLLFVYAGAGALRGYLLATGLSDLGMGSGGIEFRIPVSMISMTTTVAILTIGWDAYRTNREFQLNLQQENERLQSALTQLELETERQAMQRASEVVDDVVSELERIQLYPVREQVEAIERIITLRVRPLSHELASDIKQWVPDTSSQTSSGFREAWRLENPLNHLPQWWNGVLIAFTPLPTAVYYFGWQVAAQLLALGAVCLSLSLVMLNPLIRRALRNFRSPQREIALTFAFVLQASVAVVASQYFLRESSNPQIYTMAGLVTIPVFAWLVTGASTFWRGSVERAEQLVAVRNRLQWAVARVGLLSWFSSGVMSRLLHGPIQNTLHATLIRLRDQDPDAVMDEIVKELRSRISAVELSSDAADIGQRDVLTEIAGISELWRGIAAIDADITDLAAELLQTDTAAGAIITDLCLELTSNAIRHGGASTLKVELFTRPRACVLRVVDDGHDVAVSGRVGIGTKLLDACSIEWTRRRVGNQNELTVVIPCI